jgi:WD40 repeat protein
MAWSPCGRFIASPSTDKTIRIWDANDGKCLAMLEGHSAEVTCLSWSSGYQNIVSGDGIGVIRLWRLGRLFAKFLELRGTARERLQIRRSKRIVEPFGAVQSIAWSPDGKYFVAGTEFSVRVFSQDGAAVTEIGVGNLFFGNVWAPSSSRVSVTAGPGLCG